MGTRQLSFIQDTIRVRWARKMVRIWSIYESETNKLGLGFADYGQPFYLEADASIIPLGDEKMDFEDFFFDQDLAKYRQQLVVTAYFPVSCLLMCSDLWQHSVATYKTNPLFLPKYDFSTSVGNRLHRILKNRKQNGKEDFFPFAYRSSSVYLIFWMFKFFKDLPHQLAFLPVLFPCEFPNKDTAILRKLEEGES